MGVGEETRDGDCLTREDRKCSRLEHLSVEAGRFFPCPSGIKSYKGEEDCVQTYED